MSLCAQCGLQLSEGELCGFHPISYGEDWAAMNRIMCDFFHRGKEPDRLPVEVRTDFWDPRPEEAV